MKRSNRVLFATGGVLAGTLLTLLCRPVPLLLVFGVGPVNVGAVVLTLFFLDVRISGWRALLAVLLSAPAYFFAFLAFAATESYMQQHGGHVSSLPSDMKSDVVLGMLVAVIVASIGLECLALLLSRKWSTRAAAGLMVGGVAAVTAAYFANAIYMRVTGPMEGSTQSLVYFGPLFIVGGAFTAVIVGEQVLRSAYPKHVG